MTAEYIHPTASVEDLVQIGDGTRLWHQAHVRTGAQIGENTNIGKNVFVDIAVTIGSGVKIQNNVSVYRGVTIEDDVFVGPSAVFTNDRYPRAFNGEWEITPTLVRRRASIGANATIVCGVEIGMYAVVAAGAVVTKSVKDHEIVKGNPAQHHGWACACGRVVSTLVEEPSTFTCESCTTSAQLSDTELKDHLCCDPEDKK